MSSVISQEFEQSLKSIESENSDEGVLEKK